MPYKLVPYLPYHIGAFVCVWRAVCLIGWHPVVACCPWCLIGKDLAMLVESGDLLETLVDDVGLKKVNGGQRERHTERDRETERDRDSDLEGESGRMARERKRERRKRRKRDWIEV